MKQLLTILLLILSLSCTLAEDTPIEYTSVDFRYTLLEDGTAKIIGYGGHATDLTIPVEIDGHPVTAIGDAAFPLCLILNSITIPDGVTSIGNYAFTESYNLTRINLPDSIVSIGNGAFYGCASLTSLVIPTNVISIGTNPFCDCYHLTDIIVSSDHLLLEMIDGVLFNKAEKKLICYPWVLTAESYTVPQGTTMIDSYAFPRVPPGSISLPDSLAIIAEDAFESYSGITFTVVPGSYAEQWCIDNGLPIAYAEATGN